MRINHNITSLNTYRQLSTNTANQSKSIEKLSSGLRINRAGDDAAGLAISEKMRGQIRGLDQAARNSQDAISMIQTAEGALNETQAILQRMRELATQSANDTNTADDRKEIQNEINQLTSEINRIGNTTEFNTKKLLNGDVGIGTGQTLKTGGGAPVYTGTSLSNVSLDANATIAGGKYEAKIENLGGQTSNDVGANQAVGGATNGTVSGTDTALSAGSYKVVVTSENAVNTSAVVTGTGIASSKDLTVAANSTLPDGNYKIEIGKTTTNSVTAVATAGLSDLKLDSGSTPADGVYSITTAAKIDTVANKGAGTAASAISNIKIDADSTFAETGGGATVKIVGTGNNDEFSIQLVNDSGGLDTVVGSTTFTVSASSGVTSVRVGDLTMDVDFGALFASSNGAAGNTSAFHNDEIDFAIKDTVTITNLTDPTKTATADVTGGAGDKTFALANSGGTFTLDATAAITRGQTINVTVSTNTAYTAQLKTAGGAAVAGSTVQTLTQADLSTPSAYKNLSLGNGVTVNLDAAALTAAADSTWNTTFTTATQASLTAELQDAGGNSQSAKYTLDTSGGAKTLDLGATGATFNYSNTTTAGDFVFTVDSNTTADDFRLTLKQTHDASGAATGTVLKNQVAVDPNATIDLGDGASVKTAVTMAHGDKVTFEVEAGTVDKSLTMQVGASQGQTFSMNVSDMRSDALGISAKNSSDSTGVTGAAWTTAKAATNGTNNTAAEYTLDVSDATKASAAIKVIDNAINSVSTERSKLGAFQNRLDHTINNLQTSSENLTAAESRIRDVDMAKEMMEQTKNSILAQAAQAMLAQANQQPQGVLQLLR